MLKKSTLELPMGKAQISWAVSVSLLVPIAEPVLQVF